MDDLRSEKKLAKLDKISLFKAYSKSYKKRLLLSLDFMDIKLGTNVFKEGDDIDCIYFITKGEFELTKSYEVLNDATKDTFEFKFKPLAINDFNLVKYENIYKPIQRLLPSY